MIWESNQSCSIQKLNVTLKRKPHSKGHKMLYSQNMHLIGVISLQNCKITKCNNFYS